MKSTKKAEIELPASETFNFCFKNEKGEWDNNGGQNYTFPIEKVELALVPQDETTLDAPTPYLSLVYLFCYYNIKK